MKGAERKRRGQGRPITAEAGVGREALISAAERLLQELPPTKVTITSVAREADADPALVRYYFGNRTNLFLAVVDRLTARIPTNADARDQIEALEEHIRGTASFTRSARNMQRLMIDELLRSDDAEVAEQMRERNRGALTFYKQLIEKDGGRQLVDADPMFLHLMIVGIFDFFSSARALVEVLAGPGADMDRLTEEYEKFVVRVLLEGLRRR